MLLIDRADILVRSVKVGELLTDAEWNGLWPNGTTPTARESTIQRLRRERGLVLKRDSDRGGYIRQPDVEIGSGGTLRRFTVRLDDVAEFLKSHLGQEFNVCEIWEAVGDGSPKVPRLTLVGHCDNLAANRRGFEKRGEKYVCISAD